MAGSFCGWPLDSFLQAKTWSRTLPSFRLSFPRYNDNAEQILFDAFDSNFGAYPGPYKRFLLALIGAISYTGSQLYCSITLLQLLSSSEIAQELGECRLDLEAGEDSQSWTEEVPSSPGYNSLIFFIVFP